MKPSADLHELIHSLTASELRYFKLFVQRSNNQKQANYMLIFDLVLAQETYDEAAVLLSIQDLKVKAQFAVQKNYLYQLILRALRQFHAQSRVDFEIKDALMNVEILLQRGLIKQCIKQLAAVESLAQKHERFEVMSEVAHYKLMLLMKSEGETLEQIERNMEETLAWASRQIDLLTNVLLYRKVAFQMLMSNRRDSQVVTAQNRAAYAKILSQPTLQDAELALSARAKLYFLQARFVASFALADIEQAYELAEAMSQLMESHPHLIEDRPENYVHVLQNQVMMSTLVRPMDLTLTLTARLRGCQTRFPAIRFDKEIVHKASIYAAITELRLMLNHRQYQDAVLKIPALMAEVEGEFSYNVNEGYVLVELYFLVATIYLFAGDLNAAQHFANRLVHMPNLGPEHAYFLDVRMLMAIVLFERGEFEWMEQVLTSLQRYLQKKGKMAALEQVLIRFLRSASDLLEPKQRFKAFLSLRAELSEGIQGAVQNRLLAGFNVMEWIDGKITKLSDYQ